MSDSRRGERGTAQLPRWIVCNKYNKTIRSKFYALQDAEPDNCAFFVNAETIAGTLAQSGISSDRQVSIPRCDKFEVRRGEGRPMHSLSVEIVPSRTFVGWRGSPESFRAETTVPSSISAIPRRRRRRTPVVHPVPAAPGPFISASPVHTESGESSGCRQTGIHKL